MRNFAICVIFSDFEKMIVAIPPIPIIGNANASISTLKPKNVTSRGVSVVPMFAPITTPSALESPITPAPTNHRVIIVTIVLLWKIHVCIIPVTILFIRVFVFFSSTFFKNPFPRCEIVSSKTNIPNRNIPSHHIRFR